MKRIASILVALLTYALHAGAQGVEVTNLYLVNPSFETGDMTGWQTLREGVIQTDELGGDGPVYAQSRPVSGWPLTNADGTQICDYYMWTWTWNENLDGIQQTVSGLPAGTYTLTCVLGGWNGWNLTLDANGVQHSQTMTADNEGVNFSVTTTISEGEDLVIKATTSHVGYNEWNASFMKADNFRLYYAKNVTGMNDDMTDKFTNPSFETSKDGAAGTVSPSASGTTNFISGWTADRTNDTGNTYIGVGTAYPGRQTAYSLLENPSAENGSYYALIYRRGYSSPTGLTSGGGYKQGNGTLKQTVNLKAGTYKCTVRYKMVSTGSTAPTLTLKAGSQTATAKTYTRIDRKATIKNKDITNVEFNKTWNDVNWSTATLSFTTTGGNVEISLDVDCPNSNRSANYYYSSGSIITTKYYACVTEALLDNVELVQTAGTVSTLPEGAEGYLYNPGTGQYVSTHEGADAGTEAMLDNRGYEITVRQNSDGSVKLETPIVNGANKYIGLNSGVYSDNASTNWYVHMDDSGDFFYLKNGKNYLAANGANQALTTATGTSDATKWKLRTYAERVAELADGTVANPKDATFLIQAQGFGRNDSRMTEWVTWADGYGTTLAEHAEGAAHDDVQFRRGGKNSNYVVESYNRSFDVYQTLTTRDGVALPTGVYTLTTQNFWNNPGLNGANVPYVYIKDNDNASLVNKTQPFTKYTTGDLGFENGTISTSFTDGNFTSTPLKAFILGSSADAPASLTIGAKCDGSGSWAVFDNFQLTYRPFDASDLTAEAGDGQDLLDGMVNIGNGEFQIADDESHRATLKTAITTAQSSSATTSAEVRSSLLTLMTAKKAFEDLDPGVFRVNPPSPSKVYNIANFAYGGNMLTFKSAKGADLATNSTSMSWDEPSGSIYPQTVRFEAVEEANNKYRLSYVRADGHRIYVGTGTSTGLGTDHNQLRPTTDPSKALAVQIVAKTGTEGHWWLRNTLSGNRLIGHSNNSFYTGNVNYELALAEAEKASVDFTVKQGYHFSTLMLPFDADIPTGVEAYTVDGIQQGSIVLVKATAFEANVPYILWVEDEAELSETVEGWGAAYTDETITSSYLTGTCTTDRTVTVPAGKYVLSAKTYTTGTKVGFYRVQEGKEPTLPRNRAYFDASSASASSAPVKEAYFFGPDDDETGLSDMLTGDSEVEGIYDVKGVRLPRMQRGVNIIRMTDGTSRRVMVK